jgi:hypothetical protein
MEGNEMATILTDEFAKELNGLHNGLQNSARLLISEALVIGEKLINAEKVSDPVDLREWMDGKLHFSRRAAYRYIDLFKFQKQIKDAENLSEAYKMIGDIKSEQKQVEDRKATDRVQEYKETGKKPEGWRRGTDDKLAENCKSATCQICNSAQNATCQNVQRAQIEQEWDNLYKTRHKSGDPRIIEFMEKLNAITVEHRYNAAKKMQEWCGKIIELYV